MESIESFTGRYAFLSNFSPHSVVFQGFKYRTAEHAFQAAKTTNERDRSAIEEQMTAAKAKAWGRRVALRADWESVKDKIMHQIVRLKFQQNPELKQKLLETYVATLEANGDNDVYWGVCEGLGQNKLGFILMAIRREFQYQEMSWQLRQLSDSGHGQIHRFLQRSESEPTPTDVLARMEEFVRQQRTETPAVASDHPRAFAQAAQQPEGS